VDLVGIHENKNSAIFLLDQTGNPTEFFEQVTFSQRREMDFLKQLPDVLNQIVLDYAYISEHVFPDAEAVFWCKFCEVMHDNSIPFSINQSLELLHIVQQITTMDFTPHIASLQRINCSKVCFVCIRLQHEWVSQEQQEAFKLAISCIFGYAHYRVTLHTPNRWLPTTSMDWSATEYCNQCQKHMDLLLNQYTQYKRFVAMH
jgi:hypothetical protein